MGKYTTQNISVVYTISVALYTKIYPRDCSLATVAVKPISCTRGDELR